MQIPDKEDSPTGTRLCQEKTGNMEKLIINICASRDSFGAYSANCDGIWAAGDTIDQCKADVERAIADIKANLPEERWPAPIRNEYVIVWQYDK